MNEFETQLNKFVEESLDFQRRENALKSEMGLFNEKFSAFLTSHGLPQNFTLPEFGALVMKKSK